MYEDEFKNISINADETDKLIELLENADYASVAERLLIEGLIEKLTE